MTSGQTQSDSIRHENSRITAINGSSAKAGRVSISSVKLAWVLSCFSIAMVGGVMTASTGSFLVFLLTTITTLCLGHSIGMHRLLIHRSFKTYKCVEYGLVHFGVLVGLAGPLGMMRTHDLRDWAQRQNDCHDYFAHRQPMLKDAFWQLVCDIDLYTPPRFSVENPIASDPVYQVMEKYWILNQLPLAIILFLVGGVDWVIWGIFVRVSVSIAGHWLIGYFAHNDGDQHWHVEGADVQGFNIRFASLMTMGESWHNNHHAFPGSALLGIRKGEMDPGWWVLVVLEKLRLVWEIKTPKDIPARKELIELSSH